MSMPTMIIFGAILVLLVILFIYMKVNKIESINDVSSKLTAKVGKGKTIKIDQDSLIQYINESERFQSIGDKLPFSGNELFRKSGNPWGVTPATFSLIRFGGGGLFIIIAILAGLLFGEYAFVIFAIVAIAFIFYPVQAYKDAIEKRENAWAKSYSIIWVLKANLTFYDPKKACYEVAEYLKYHEGNEELIQGFTDLANHFNGETIDEYMQELYGDFEVPTELHNILIGVAQTGEYPDAELSALREMIVTKSNFIITQVLAQVESRATLISTPALLIALAIIIIVPVGLQILEQL